MRSVAGGGGGGGRGGYLGERRSGRHAASAPPLHAAAVAAHTHAHARTRTRTHTYAGPRHDAEVDHSASNARIPPPPCCCCCHPFLRPPLKVCKDNQELWWFLFGLFFIGSDMSSFCFVVFLILFYITMKIIHHFSYYH